MFKYLWKTINFFYGIMLILSIYVGIGILLYLSGFYEGETSTIGTLILIAFIIVYVLFRNLAKPYFEEKMNEQSIDKENCKCHTPPLSYLDYTKRLIGIDETNGRFGEVTIEKCKHCNSLWLRYFAEYEAFSKSGRWYRGLITQENLTNITPENSVDYLESLEWHLYGGSYFNTTGKRGHGNILVDF